MAEMLAPGRPGLDKLLDAFTHADVSMFADTAASARVALIRANGDDQVDILPSKACAPPSNQESVGSPADSSCSTVTTNNNAGMPHAVLKGREDERIEAGNTGAPSGGVHQALKSIVLLAAGWGGLVESHPSEVHDVEGYEEFFASAEGQTSEADSSGILSFPPEAPPGKPYPEEKKRKLESIREECRSLHDRLSKVQARPALQPYTL